jgi:hypothetical protein
MPYLRFGIGYQAGQGYELLLFSHIHAARQPPHLAICVINSHFVEVAYTVSV